MSVIAITSFLVLLNQPYYDRRVVEIRVSSIPCSFLLIHHSAHFDLQNSNGAGKILRPLLWDFHTTGSRNTISRTRGLFDRLISDPNSFIQQPALTLHSPARAEPSHVPSPACSTRRRPYKFMIYLMQGRDAIPIPGFIGAQHRQKELGTSNAYCLLII